MKQIIATWMLIPLMGTAQVPEIRIASDRAKEVLAKGQMTIAADPVSFVDPFVGTGAHGHTFPGPVVPFGMVQVGPDTRFDGWDGCGGYHYSDSIIYGFSHTHLSGVGVPDYADVLLVPQQGKLKLDPLYKSKDGFGAGFSHQQEKAAPGYYTVELQNNIRVRLTATDRCALHEYTFGDAKGKKYLLIDLGYRDKVLETHAKAQGKNKITGMRRSNAWATDQHLYFDLETDISFSKAKWVVDEKKGRYVMVLEFPATTKKVMVRVGLSGTDEQGAKANLKAELNTWDFESVMRAAAEKWRAELTKVFVSSPDLELQRNFYTALYHTYVHPSLWTDVDGRYRTFNNTIEQSDMPLYSVFSLWDTYRGANPLYTILQPKRTQEFIESFRLQYQQTGLLPVWTLSNNETNCMIGYHSVSVIADAALKGIEVKNPQMLLEAMIASSTRDQLGKKQYGEWGFISANAEAESVSKTLEYAYDDWCISKFAEKLGNTEVAEKYALRASNWMNLLHPESGFFQPRKGGLWLPNFRPNEVNHHYTEANAWQYSLAAPQHLAQLVQVRGGAKGMETFLDSLFTSSSQLSGREQADITGLIGQYAHGNEPSHHMAYAYNYTGAPHKTQFYLNKIMREHYHHTPEGLSGNEDCGQMSAWFVLNAMGFYPVAPGNPTYAIGRPMFNMVSLKAGTKAFVIETKNNSEENTYIQSISWNGEAYHKLYITHEMIVSGGELEIVMGAQPNPSLATYETDLKEKAPETFVPVPHFFAASTVFSDKLEIGMDKLPFETGTIYYSLNGKDFLPFDVKKDKNITLTTSGSVYAKVVRDENGKHYESAVIHNEFTRFVKDKTIVLETEYANQYAGGGPQCLVDGQRGTNEYRGTEWQGFFGKDVAATIELDEPKEITKIIVSALQDQRSWIFAPKGFEVEVSTDGTNFKSLGAVQVKQVGEEPGVRLKEMVLDCVPTQVKFIRIKVLNAGACPSWHLGAGNPTWLFLDEIILE